MSAADKIYVYNTPVSFHEMPRGYIQYNQHKADAYLGTIYLTIHSGKYIYFGHAIILRATFNLKTLLEKHFT